MPKRRRFLAFAASLVGMLLPARHFTSAAWAEEPECAPHVTVGGSFGTVAETPYGRVYDGDEATSITSPHEGWQYVELDFACPVKVGELRRHMTRGGSSAGLRESGEGILYSLDGVRWRDLDADSTAGWEDAEFARRDTAPDDHAGAPRYRGAFWKKVPYGWSPRLSPRSPLYARFLRFNWQSVDDSLHELSVHFEPAHTIEVDWKWDLARWDWTENDLLELHYDGDERRPAQPVALPWNESDGECRQEHPDIAPENGWVLLAGNLGTSPLVPLPEYPYFFLYNRYRGLIRSHFFYGARYNDLPGEATHQMGSLVTEGGPVPAFTHHTAQTLADFDPGYEQIFVKKELRLNRWACLEFDAAGYDPNVAHPDKAASAFMLRFYKLTQADLDASGFFNVNGFLDAADMRTGKRGSGDWDTLADASGAFLRVAGIFDDVASVGDKLDEFSSSGPSSAWWWGRIQGAASALASGDTRAFVDDLAGFVTAVSAGGGASSIPLSWRVDLTGELALSGTLSTAGPLDGVRFYVPGSVYGWDSRLEPLYHEPLGVYALNYEPTIYWYSRQDGYRAVNLDVDASWASLNPHAGLQLISAQAAMVAPHYEPTPFKDLDDYILDPNTRMTDAQLDSLKVGLRLELQPVGQPLADPVVMYQEFSAVKVYDGAEPQSGGH